VYYCSMQEIIPNVAFNHSKGISGFEIMSLSELFAKEYDLSHTLYQPHRLTFYQLMYISKGTGHHTVDFQTFPLGEGTLVFIAPGQVHMFEQLHSIEGYVCLFTEEFLGEEFLQIMDRYIIDHLYFKDITRALVLENNSMGIYFELMYKEFHAMHTNNNLGVLIALLHVILLKSKEQFQKNYSDQETSELFNKFKKMLLAKYSKMHNADEYAIRLKVSPKHLNVTCKRLTGLTTKAFIARFLILEAKRYLASSSLPIKDISTKVGYLEVTNFVKFFKKHTGMTPKAFRCSQD